MTEDAPMAEVAEAQVVDIAAAEEKVMQGKNLIDDDPEKAVELLCAAVRAYEKHFGSDAIECAPVYMYYGIALYEVARNATDALGATKTTVEPIAAEKSGQAAPPAAGSAADTATGESDASAVATAKEEKTKQEEKVEAIAAEPEIAVQSGDDKAAPGPAPAPDAEVRPAEDACMKASEEGTTSDDKENKDAGAAAVATTSAGGDEGDAAAAGDGEGDGEGEGDAEGEEEGGEEGGDGAAGAEEEESGGDDMKLAWDMLELARIIYEKSGDLAAHHERLAEVHKALGDIKGEEERFEEAVECYKQSLQHLESMQPRNSRRLAEVQYKVSVALTFLEQPEEALSVTMAALSSLESAVAETEEKLGALPTDGSGGEAAEEEGRRLQGVSDDLRGVIAEMHCNVEGLKETIANNNSLKEALKQAFLKAKDGGLDGAAAGTGAAVAAAGAILSKAFSAPSNPAAAAQAVSLGTVGRGSKRITLQPTSAPPQAQAPAPGKAPLESGKPGAAAEGPAPSKRTLEDLMGGAPAAGGVTTAGFGAVAVVEAREEQQAKKARMEAPAAEAAAVADAK